MSQINTTIGTVGSATQAVGQPQSRGQQKRQPRKSSPAKPENEVLAEEAMIAPVEPAESSASHLDVKG